MNKNFLSVAALLGALSVALGAFAAHKLREMVPPDAVAVFETGVRYQFYHVFALLFVALLSERISNKWMIWAGNCLSTGMVAERVWRSVAERVKGGAERSGDWAKAWGAEVMRVRRIAGTKSRVI